MFIILSKCHKRTYQNTVQAHSRKHHEHQSPMLWFDISSYINVEIRNTTLVLSVVQTFVFINLEIRKTSGTIEKIVPAPFSPNRPTGPIRSSSRDVRLCVCVFVCLSPSHAIFLKCQSQKTSDMPCYYSFLLINS